MGTIRGIVERFTSVLGTIVVTVGNRASLMGKFEALEGTFRAVMGRFCPLVRIAVVIVSNADSILGT